MTACIRPPRALALLALVVSLAMAFVPDAAATAAATPHVVVMKDGRAVPSRTRPLIAFGEVRYQDADGHLHVLPGADVNVEATRNHPANQGGEHRTARISVAGSDVVPINMPAAAKSLPSVTMYSATWCGVCKRAKAWFDAKGVPYSVIDVDTLPKDQQKSTMAEMQRLAGRVVYPVIVVGGRGYAGFSESSMSAALGLGSSKGATRGAAPRR